VAEEAPSGRHLYRVADLDPVEAVDPKLVSLVMAISSRMNKTMLNTKANKPIRARRSGCKKRLRCFIA
jgi:hypothetical protein